MKHTTARIQKLLSGVLITVFFMGLLGGCGKVEDFVVDSKVNYTITVPKSMDGNAAKVWFQAPFYRVFMGEEPYSEPVKESYLAGQEAVLEGEHVEQLDGAQVLVYVLDLKEDVDENFYRNIARKRCGNIEEPADPADYDKMQKEQEEKIEKEAQKVKKELGSVVERAKILSASIVFDGCITEDVTIDRLEIPTIGFSYSFDHFQITTCEFEEGAVTDAGETVDYMQAGGIFAGEGISADGYLPLEGMAQTDIQSIEICSLNDVCTIIDEDNYEKFGESYSSVIGSGQLNDYRKGDTLAFTVSYVLDGIEHIEDYDAAMASLLVKYLTVDGEKVWSLYYQPAVTEAKYLLVSHYDEIIH